VRGALDLANPAPDARFGNEMRHILQENTTLSRNISGGPAFESSGDSR
jgi:hypothetical protein